jgi:hypothetical protein
MSPLNYEYTPIAKKSKAENKKNPRFFGKKEARPVSRTGSHVLEQYLLCAVYNCLCLSHRKRKFLCQRLITYAVNQPPLQDAPITL